MEENESGVRVRFNNGLESGRGGDDKGYVVIAKASVELDYRESQAQ